MSQEEILDSIVRRYGTHSIRKGSATYASSGTTHSPSHAAIANRAGWSLGIRSRYLRYEDAGDEFVGRTVCGLNVNDISFGVLAPRFKEGYEEIVDEILHDCFVRYDAMPPNIQRVLKMCIASVVYHREVLLERYLKDEWSEVLQKPVFSKKYGVERLSDITEIEVWRPGKKSQPMFSFF